MQPFNMPVYRISMEPFNLDVLNHYDKVHLDKMFVNFVSIDIEGNSLIIDFFFDTKHGQAMIPFSGVGAYPDNIQWTVKTNDLTEDDFAVIIDIIILITDEIFKVNGYLD